MKLVITGASGFIGKQIVPRLLTAGVKLLLVGRDTRKLQALFPGTDACEYADLAQAASGYDQLLHLAVLNNDQPGDDRAFETANVDLLKTVIEAMKVAGVRTLTNVSSVQVLDDRIQTPYARSKRKALSLLENGGNPEIRTFFLPAVYGDHFAGNLGLLNKLPGSLAFYVFPCLAALKPTVHADRVVDAILSTRKSGIVSDGQQRNFIYRILKKLVDLAFAIFVIVFLWWLLAGAWLAVKLSSKGPGIFAQDRIGRGGKVFTCYKFRTMSVGTRQAGTHEVSSASVTKTGHFMRRTKLDELPQVINILCGELSLIGPRPCLPVQTDLIRERNERGVLDILPGISGLAQVQGIDMSVPVILAEKDAEYIALQSLFLDAKIALKTASGSGVGDKVGV